MRASGILLDLRSLPSRFGIGGMGAEAEQFVSFLAETKQSLWQILPVSIPDSVHSPYASPSAFAGDPLIIAADSLFEDGLLTQKEARPASATFFSKIDYDHAAEEKMCFLRRAYASFQSSSRESAWTDFCQRNAFWLDDFALYTALKAHFDARPFWEWHDLRAQKHDRDALAQYQKTLATEIDFWKFTQYVFMRQITDLRSRLRAHGIRLIGDIPFYVARDSADVWAHPELFCLSETGAPRLVAGVPPDYFSTHGQLWGNPIYDWERMEADGFAFWIARLTRCAELYDVTRLDHFRALDSYYTIPGTASDARNGVWIQGPGARFLSRIREALPQLSLIAEDLGELTPSVHRLRTAFDLPGMRVMQFAFDGTAENAFLPHNYDKNTVVYLGTHDNDTSVGWWKTLPAAEKAHAAAYLDLPPGTTAESAVRRMMAVASASPANSVIFTMQDLCLSGSESRTNTPSATNCWRYAAPPTLASRKDADFLSHITHLYGRAPHQSKGENA